MRLANLAAIILGQHLTKVEDVYWCRFTTQETKNSRPLAFPMPKILTAWIDEYLAMQRPLLLRGVNSLRLWISLRSTPMMDNSIYYRVTTLTKRLVGKPINPHLFRYCVATFIAEESPEEVRIISQILGHAALSTAEEYYIQAGMLTAQRRYLQTIEEIRQLPGAEGE